MKKVVLVLFVLVIALFFILLNVKSADDYKKSMNKINSDLADFIHLTHEELYERELQKLSFQFNQEPFLHMSQRYSRKMLSSTKAKKSIVIIPSEKTVVETVISKADTLKYTLQRIEQLSGSFQQAKIYATVNSQDKTALRELCIRIWEQYDEFISLVICLYSETETGISMAQGENAHFSEKDISISWLVFYSYHPVEGDYFDDNPGGYLVSGL